jgi:hypothetical protein
MGSLLAQSKQAKLKVEDGRFDVDEHWRGGGGDGDADHTETETALSFLIEQVEARLYSRAGRASATAITKEYVARARFEVFQDCVGTRRRSCV